MTLRGIDPSKGDIGHGLGSGPTVKVLLREKAFLQQFCRPAELSSLFGDLRLEEENLMVPVGGNPGVGLEDAQRFA